jgi:hypothetical protein
VAIKKLYFIVLYFTACEAWTFTLFSCTIFMYYIFTYCAPHFIVQCKENAKCIFVKILISCWALPHEDCHSVGAGQLLLITQDQAGEKPVGGNCVSLSSCPLMDASTAVYVCSEWTVGTHLEISCSRPGQGSAVALVSKPALCRWEWWTWVPSWKLRWISEKFFLPILGNKGQ